MIKKLLKRVPLLHSRSGCIELRYRFSKFFSFFVSDVPSYITKAYSSHPSRSTSNLRFILFALLPMLLIRCNSLDDDTNFLYSHKSSFLISDQSQLYQFILANDTLKFYRKTYNVHDGAIVNSTLLFLDTIHSKLVSYQNPQNLPSERTLPYAYTLVNGWKDFQIFSNSNETLLEKHRHSKKETLKLSKGAEYIYCNQGRLWLIQKRKVFVYDLNAGALLDEFELEKDFYFADYDKGFNLLVFTKDSSGIYQKFFDTNAISTSNEIKVNFQKIQLSKVLTRLYETEYLRNVELNAQNRLNIANFSEEVHSFDMDFQSSRLFYTRNDSLFVLNINTSKKQFLLANFGKIKKGLHFYSQK